MARVYHRRKPQIRHRRVRRAASEAPPERSVRYLNCLLLGIASLALLGLLTCSDGPPRVDRLIDSHYDPLMRSLPRYVELFSSIAPRAVRDDVRAVHIFKNDRWHCSGTALRWSATSEIILTSLHGFGRPHGDGTYTYRVMTPFDPTVHPIANVQVAPHWQQLFGREPDVALCIPGPARFIPSLSDLVSVDPNRHSSINLDQMADERWVVSLLTGERYRCLVVGYDVRTQKAHHLIFDYQSLDGESGSGFLIEGWPDALLVLGGTIEYGPEIRRGLLPPAYAARRRGAYGYVFAYEREGSGLKLMPIGVTD